VVDHRADANQARAGDRRSGFLKLAFSRAVVLRALRVAALVGTLLALINHGDRILTASLTAWGFGQILLTYLVPYSVSVWSSVRALQSGYARPGGPPGSVS